MKSSFKDLFQWNKSTATQETVVEYSNSINPNVVAEPVKPIKQEPRKDNAIFASFDRIWSMDGRPKYVKDNFEEGCTTVDLYDTHKNHITTSYVEKEVKNFDIIMCLKGTFILPGFYIAMVTGANSHKKEIPVEII